MQATSTSQVHSETSDTQKRAMLESD
jgi:hypothetical protein